MTPTDPTQFLKRRRTIDTVIEVSISNLVLQQKNKTKKEMIKLIKKSIKDFFDILIVRNIDKEELNELKLYLDKQIGNIDFNRWLKMTPSEMIQTGKDRDKSLRTRKDHK